MLPGPSSDEKPFYPSGGGDGPSDGGAGIYVPDPTAPHHGVPQFQEGPPPTAGPLPQKFPPYQPAPPYTEAPLPYVRA